MDREVLRSLLFEQLKIEGNTQIVNVTMGIGLLAMQRGHIEKPTDFVYYRDNLLAKNDQLVVQELIWEFIIQGILTPGTVNGENNLPFIRLTEYGKQCVNEQRVLPHDYGRYLDEVKNIIGADDPVFILYIEESVQAFLKDLYLSAVVNLGVASERLTEQLIDAYRLTLHDVSKEVKFDEAMNKARHASKKFDELYKRLETEKSRMPNELAENLEMVRYLAELIRRERNDGGHPTGRRFARDEALVLLLAFPPHLRVIAALLELAKRSSIGKKSIESITLMRFYTLGSRLWGM